MEVESMGDRTDDVVYVENDVGVSPSAPVSPMNMVIGNDLARASRHQAENIYVSKSSRVQIGPKFVSVTQNVSQNEVVKDLHAPWYLRRADWQAMPAYSTTFLHLPVRMVVIGHTAIRTCDHRYNCIERVLEVQQDHLRRDYDDIGPNFLVGGKEGLVFEGRGANVRAAAVSNWNSRIISVMFIGDFSIEEVASPQTEHLKMLIKVLVNEGVLVSDYVVYGHCQIQTEMISPGRNVMDMLVTFPRWSPVNASRCLRSRSTKSRRN